MDENTNGLATLYGKMAAIMGNVERLPKDGFNKFLNYSFTTESDIADTIRKELAGQNIAFFANLVDVMQTPKDKGFHTVATFEFTFACGDTGATITRRWIGEADDSLDKGINKASTLAMKFFLLRTFVMSTGDPADDPDSGNPPPQKPKPAASAQDPNRAGPPAPRTQPVKPAPKAEPEAQPALSIGADLDPAEVVNAAGGARDENARGSEMPERARQLTEDIAGAKKLFPWNVQEWNTRIEDMLPKDQSFWKRFWARLEKMGYIGKTKETRVHNNLGVSSIDELAGLSIGEVWLMLYRTRPQKITRALEPNAPYPGDEPAALKPAVNQ